MLKIYQADSVEDMAHVNELNREYLNWLKSKAKEIFDVELDIESKYDQDVSRLDEFDLPQGRLLLAEYDSQIAGMGCIRKILEGVCEIKRLYVRSTFRGKSIARRCSIH